MGFSCLAPSARDFGLSGKSTHPNILTWGYDYHLDLLGAWDYAVNDPDGVLGGKYPEDQDIEVLKKVKRGHYSMEGSIWSSVSTLAKDLIRGCLEMDPAKRLTSMQALNHGWFQVHNSSALLDAKQARYGFLCLPGDVIRREVLGNLRNFSVANRFQKAAMTAVAYQLTTEEQAELREVFMKLDANSDGYLSFQEIKQGMECQLNEAHFPNLSEILGSMDTNNDGKIEYTEFIAAAMDHRLQRNESLCWRAFKAFDKDDDGKITLSELKQVLKDDELQQEVPSSSSVL